MGLIRRRQKHAASESPQLVGDSTDGEDLTRERIPQHVAIIMDGNGRWAQSRGLPRIEGHRKGADSVQSVLEACGDLGIRYLTLYCFSIENWKRPRTELDFLMGLLKLYLRQQAETLVKNGIRLQVLGRREGMSPEVLEIVDHAVEISKLGERLTLSLAINYGSRQEIVDAVRKLAVQVARGELAPESIDEMAIEQSLYTAGIPDPDLVIRTSGELRLSNFLLWQISYSELWVTDTFWPDFGKPEFLRAIQDYAQRKRRFGGVDPPS